MAGIQIPDSDLEGLSALFSLSKENADKLSNALEQAPTKLYPAHLVIELTAKIPEIDPEDLNNILNVLYNLHRTKLFIDVSSEDLAEDICDSLENEEELFEFSPESREQFKQRLIRLLNIEPLTIRAKAATLLRNQENMFCSAEVMTDMRPIFGQDPEMAPQALVVVHMLNLRYHNGGEVKEFYVALDSEDIQSLKDILDRAEVKEESLRSTFKDLGIPFLEAE